jgi:P27 family predicted phage terminase small subunit
METPGRPPGSSRRSEFSPAAGTSAALIGAPTCPEELDEVGKAKWTEIVTFLTAMELITKADSDMMGLYCAAYSRWYAAEAKVKQFGAILKSKQGGLYRSPYLDVVIQASKEMQKLSRVLGLDAMSRKKLGIPSIRVRGVAAPDSKELPLPTPKPPTAADVRDLLKEQVDAVMKDTELTTLEKARCVASLGRVTLRAIEDGDTAARLEALEAVLKTRKNEEAKP